MEAVMAWTNVLIDKEQIIGKTNRAVLVKEPGTDWLVWISWKVMRKMYIFGQTFSLVKKEIIELSDVFRWAG